MDISDSPVSDWSKESEYNDWFARFDLSPDEEESFEVLDSSNTNSTPQEGGETDDQ